MTDVQIPSFDTREEWRAARAPIMQRIEAKARETLKPGDRIRAARCGGRKITVTMTGWDGCWVTSRKHDDIHPINIDRVNGRPTTFIDDGDRPLLDVPPPQIEDRRARARWSSQDGVIYITALRGKGTACAILPEDVGPLLRALVAAEVIAERIGRLSPHWDRDPEGIDSDDEVPF